MWKGCRGGLQKGSSDLTVMYETISSKSDTIQKSPLNAFEKT